MTAMSGRYTDPVVVFDFASLYPSCMEEMGTCPSARLTRARAAELGVAVLTPPAPSLDGRWLRHDGAETVVTDDWQTGAIGIEGRTFRYETDLNEAIVDGAGARAELFDRGYGLRWGDGVEWRRRPDEVLCFTAREVFVGVVPQMEKDLKVERKEAKKRMAAAEAAGDAAAAAFFNNVQVRAGKGWVKGGRKPPSGFRDPPGKKIRFNPFSPSPSGLGEITDERFVWRVRNCARGHLSGRPGHRRGHHGHRARLAVRRQETR